eukprot:879126-Amphidinium_carterae.1
MMLGSQDCVMEPIITELADTCNEIGRNRTDGYIGRKCLCTKSQCAIWMIQHWWQHTCKSATNSGHGSRAQAIVINN